MRRSCIGELGGKPLRIELLEQAALFGQALLDQLDFTLPIEECVRDALDLLRSRPGGFEGSRDSLIGEPRVLLLATEPFLAGGKEDDTVLHQRGGGVLVER